jgi:hypothetical protein
MKKVSLSLIVALALAAPAAGAPVNLAAYVSLTGNTVADISDVPSANWDGILLSGGLSFAERLLGQSLAFNGNFDVLGDTATAAALQVGAANQNVVTTGGVVAGLGPLGNPDANAIGEGALAVLFPTAQFELGFRIFGSNPPDNSARVRFWDAAGGLIGSVTLVGFSDGLFGFRREGNVADIMAITIDNLDGAGIGFDDFKYDNQAVPEPASLVLLGAGLAAGARRLRRKA